MNIQKLKHFFLIAAFALIAIYIGYSFVRHSSEYSKNKVLAEGFQKECDLGNAKACTRLGNAYKYGRGVIESKETAIRILIKACDLGDGSGCQSLGLMYGLENLEKQIEFLKKACDLGDGMGCQNLGSHYEVEIHSGKTVSKQMEQELYERANSLYKKSCDLGYGVGCGQLGVSYEKGNGVPRSIEFAKQYFQKGCDLKVQDDCRRLSELSSYK